MASSSSSRRGCRAGRSLPGARRPGRHPPRPGDRTRSPFAGDFEALRGALAVRDRARARKRRAQGVRLCCLARPDRAAADHRRLRPAAPAALRGPARRVRRRVHRFHRRRDGADAGVDRGTSLLFADRALGVGHDPRRSERNAQPGDRRPRRRDRRGGSRDRDGELPPWSRATRRSSAGCSKT